MLTTESNFFLRALPRTQRWLSILVLSAALGGCGGDNGAPVGSSVAASNSGSATNTSTSSTNTTPTVTIAGSVGDGPVTGSTVTIYDSSGVVLGTTVSDGSASYRKTLQVKSNQYPLRLVASGGIDLVTGHAPDFKMVSVMLRASDPAVNINPFSTLIVNTAMRMPGGLTGSNVGKARTIVLDKLGFGLEMKDPIKTPVTTGNVADLVKASEALGELVRRTRGLIAATGKPASGNGVVSALAADLVDGFVDGLGASGTDATVSAVASVVSGQVLVEAMSNTLRVGGLVATSVIDQSIRTTQAGVSNSQLSSSVRINSQMIRQADIAISAIKVLDNSAALTSIEQKISTLAANSTASSVAKVLPSGTTGTLSSAINQVATAPGGDVKQINQVVFAQGDTGTSTSSSTSPGSGSSTGTSGTAASAGSTASAGSAGSTVTQSSAGSTGSTGATGSTASTPPTGNFTVSWTAPAARSDGTPLALSAIGGYRIYYGKQRGSYPNSSTVSDATASRASVSNLASGTYYVAMTTYDTSGLESGYSTEVVKNVP